MDRFCVIGVVLALAAGGCSAGATEEPSPTTSRSVVTEQPTATASETVPAPPEIPAEAKEMTEAGADAFARHWFDVVEYAYATGNTEPLRALAESECEICNASIAEIEERAQQGLITQGLNIEVLTSAAAPGDNRGVVVTMTVRESDSRVVDADGEVQEESPASGQIAVNVYVANAGTEWQLFEIGVIT
ncbi:DUF6318 family protein [Quadrisphaera sp. GCM10027208]|uniref:DUF6318 family protein n=1 Tax=Quadrisphaera sp. GCM10027208 TaxID=3273423 RepID=UPI00361E9F06